MNKPRMHGDPDPVLMSDPRSVILENWTTDVRNDALYLVGIVSGHQTVKNGTLFRTPPVKWLRDDIGIARTQTEVYILRNRR